MKHAPSQQRRHERYPVRISCELTISGETLHAETRNLSTGGAAILFARPLTVGEVVTVSFFLTQDGIEDPDRSPFECAASIRWVNPAGDRGHEAGLQFLSPSAEQRVLLSDFLRQVA
ncbi:MAG: PilZ domain-containing protein [Polyangiales bacterium]